MTATEKHFPPYIDSENTDADTQGNAESWVTPDRALRYKGAIEFRLLSSFYQELENYGRQTETSTIP